MLRDLSSRRQDEGYSPLHVAVANGHDTVAAFLLSNGAEVNQANNNGQKPIDVANTQMMKDMLLAHMKKKEEESQWLQAAMKGDLAVIQQGINDKIDINCRESGGRTAVLCAAEQGHVLLLEYLLSQQADLSIPNVSANDVMLPINFRILLSFTLINTYAYPTNYQSLFESHYHVP